MTRTAKYYSGEDTDPIYDYTDYVIWEESEFGSRAHNGEGSSSTIIMRDALGQIGDQYSRIGLPSGIPFKALNAKSLFVCTLDESSYLYRGRVGIKNYSRDGQKTERYRQVEVELHDTNWDLDHIFVHNYSRPSETDKARVQGLIASYLAGSPRRTTHLNGSNYISSSNTVTLPAQTYTRTTPLGVLQQIAETSNKLFFITGDTRTGGSLFYDGNDSTAYASTLTISDREDEVRANPGTYFAPIWNVGPASTEDGSQLLSHLILFYGTGEDQYVTASSSSVETQYAHAADVMSDDTVTTAAAAQARAQSILVHRGTEDKVYNVTIGPLSDAQVQLVRHGMTINIKARAIPDADDAFRLMRIGQCRYTTPVSGTWFAHLQLGRPWKMAPYPAGPTLVPQPPTTGEPPSNVASWSDHGFTDGDIVENKISNINILGGSTGMLVAFIVTNQLAVTAAYWQIDQSGALDTTRPMTQIGTELVIGDNHLSAWKIDAPTASVAQTGTQRGKVHFHQGAGLNRGYAGIAHYVTGLSSFTVVNASASSATGSVTTPISGVTTGYLLLEGTSLVTDNSPFASQAVRGTRLAGQTAGPTVDLTGLEYVGIGTSYKTASGTSDSMGWTGWSTTGGGFSGTAEIVVGLLGSAGSGSVQPVGEDSDSGDAGIYAPINHVHAHGSLTNAADYHDADQISIDDDGAYYTATNVEAALQELGGVTGGFVTNIDGGKEVINTVVASGSTETLDLGLGNYQDITLTANCTLSLTGATAGVGCSVTVLLRQDSTGGWTVTWPGSVVWPDGTTPTLATDPDAVDTFVLFTLDGGTVWYGFAAGAGTTSSTTTTSDTHVHIVDERHSGDASTTVFTLANSAEPESAVAYVSGTRTPVTVGGTLNDEITFAAAPASAVDNISVDYIAPAD